MAEQGHSDILSQPDFNPKTKLVWPHNAVEPTTPQKLLRHFQAMQEADFRYATLFWPNYMKYEEKIGVTYPLQKKYKYYY